MDTAVADATAARRTFAILAFLLSAIISSYALPSDMDQICELKNAEDMIVLTGTHWAIASRLAKDPNAPGAFSLVDLRKRRAKILTPDVSSGAAAPYSSCPGAPEASALITHGLDMRQGRGARELFAVNHGGRESIEVFDILIEDDGVTLRWKGCVVLPPEVSANAVAALRDGIAVTSFGSAGEAGTEELLAGNPRGFVVTWSPAKGWAHMPGSEFGGDNGVTVDREGTLLYVDDWSDGSLRILPLQGTHAAQTIPLGDFHPDNIHLTAKGELLVAGQIGTARDIMVCTKNQVCSVGSMFVILDPKTNKVRARWTLSATSTFAAASTAVQYGREIWATSFRGDCIVRAPITGHSTTSQ